MRTKQVQRRYGREGFSLKFSKVVDDLWKGEQGRKEKGDKERGKKEGK
jgi:hypothetical protein